MISGIRTDEDWWNDAIKRAVRAERKRIREAIRARANYWCEPGRIAKEAASWFAFGINEPLAATKAPRRGVR